MGDAETWLCVITAILVTRKGRVSILNPQRIHSLSIFSLTHTWDPPWQEKICAHLQIKKRLLAKILWMQKSSRSRALCEEEEKWWLLQHQPWTSFSQCSPPSPAPHPPTSVLLMHVLQRFRWLFQKRTLLTSCHITHFLKIADFFSFLYFAHCLNLLTTLVQTLTIPTGPWLPFSAP